MLKYGKNIIFNPERLHPLNIDRQSLAFIRVGTRVLDIGCATGFMGNYLKKKKNCEVVGVEIAKEEADQARKVLDQVVTGDIEEVSVLNKIEGRFDVILMSAVVEHLKDPWKTLNNLKRFFTKNGFLIITTSNIAHWSARYKILFGKFEYTDFGIFDNTHLRFFTTETFPKLVNDSGLRIKQFSIDPVGGGLPKVSLVMSKIFPNLFAYQMLIKAVPETRKNTNGNSK